MFLTCHKVIIAKTYFFFLHVVTLKKLIYYLFPAFFIIGKVIS
ncbi:hypothetical protein EVA_10932 [gut metagenome]|uniref:Uncharacterized protein n=1 Tax=gut metagenome TaxID=749906 RepID=J9CLH4_9ZZZZ